MLGFKSFCDRTEIHLSGGGIAAVVGPNGCGKSNIADAVMWVLGEQSAKSLRGAKMEDVIFAGTRDRKATGMAEVSLTLVDPEVYDGAALGDEAAGGDWSSDGSSERELAMAGDWDETELRQMQAADTEEAVREAQPGVVVGIDQGTVPPASEDRSLGTPTGNREQGTEGAGQGSVDPTLHSATPASQDRSPGTP